MEGRWTKGAKTESSDEGGGFRSVLSKKAKKLAARRLTKKVNPLRSKVFLVCGLVHVKLLLSDTHA